MSRVVFASRESNVIVSASGKDRLDIYSFFPCDKSDCECQKMVLEMKKKLSTIPANQRADLLEKTGHLVCPRDKSGMNRYKITCGACGDVVGFCWATDASLTDWCDFHYVQWTDGQFWYGCFTPHISPITQQLCIECACGQDTRDFRANMTLPGILAEKMENENVIGREFNSNMSKFQVGLVDSSVLPFSKEGIKKGEITWPK